MASRVHWRAAREPLAKSACDTCVALGTCIGCQVGEAKAKTTEDVVALRGELARELSDVRKAVAAHEQGTAQLTDRLMLWLEQSAQEVCNLRAKVRGGR